MNGWKLALAALVIAALAFVFLSAYGALRWNRLSRDLHARLAEAHKTPAPARVDLREVDGLPAPVQRYLRAVLTDGAPMVAAVDIAHTGTFDMGPATPQWKAFTSTQRVVTRAPGFVWDGRVALAPGLPVRVHDAYVAGEGILHAAVLGLFTVAELRGTREVAEGELMRYLAEAAWYPTALLPSQGVRWEPVNARTARATLADGPVRVTLSFHFDEDGLIRRVGAEARGRTVDGRVVPTPWEGRWSDYEVRDGLKVPTAGEVGWRLPEGDKPYWRGHVTGLRYEFAR